MARRLTNGCFVAMNLGFAAFYKTQLHAVLLTTSSTSTLAVGLIIR